MKRFEDAGASVEYPASWTTRGPSAEEEKDGLRLIASGPELDEGIPFRVTLFRQDSDYASIAQYGKVVAGRRAFDLNDGKIVDDREIEVMGRPEGGWIVLTDYTFVDESGPEIPGRWIDVLARSGTQQFRLTLTGPRERMEDPEVERIMRSLRVG